MCLSAKAFFFLAYGLWNTKEGDTMPRKRFFFVPFQKRKKKKKLGHPLIIVNHAINLSVPQMNTAREMKQSLLACDVSST